MGLTAVGLFIVIALPYLLSLANKLFRSSHSVDVVEDKITSVEDRIDKTITTIPDILAFPVFTELGSKEEIYYPGLRPLWSAIFSDKDISVVTGHKGLMLVSKDNGEHWQKITTRVNSALWPPVFSREKNGVMSDELGVIFTSNDGGLNWTHYLSGASKH
ncbi:hypothetical protein [Reinekea sp. G2M2-21]|uniref:WD40/YVTN/BNR-like repeat-containing protein n=1 Tax=Reinekea sp. G2M2-21 TaxID=2788942 RepID=UPI0018AB1FFC|nr:hypothetical protein [Reinekea sp. G2M2-21]